MQMVYSARKKFYPGIFSHEMRLSQIKISGFKSFVDPTKIAFPANITGIVGPNGCGKSNVIDAVRWVMGESSARETCAASRWKMLFSAVPPAASRWVRPR